MNVDIIDKKYGIVLESNLTNIISNNKNITKISELNSENRYFSYLDESKKNHKCLITLIDYIKEQKIPEKTSINCFWCKYSFSSSPLSCPISFVPSQLKKRYYSEITKDKYEIRENISFQKQQNVIEKLEKKEITDKKISITKNNYYLCDGIFCSFNCCLAFINDNSHKPLYNKSSQFLHEIFYRIFSDSKKGIIAAPSWRLLENYGGTLTIDDFRDSFNRVEYSNIDNWIKDLPHLRPIGFLFEEKIRF